MHIPEGVHHHWMVSEHWRRPLDSAGGDRSFAAQPATRLYALTIARNEAITTSSCSPTP